MGYRARTRLIGVAAIAVLATCLLPASPAAAKSKPLVPRQYFSVHFDYNVFGHSKKHRDKLDRALADISARGIKRIRVAYSWREMQPNAPGAGGPNYRWVNFDRFVSMAAEHGIRTNANFLQPPNWAATFDLACSVAGVSSNAPRSDMGAAWSTAVTAFARRYGRSGRFWEKHPSLPYRPIVNYEIWNEPNLAGYWCPRADPTQYGIFLGLAADAVHAVDRRAEVIFGGLSPAGADRPNSYGPNEFTAATLAARPQLVEQLDAIGYHPYSFGSKRNLFNGLIAFRQTLHDVGVPNRMPIQGTESGWAQGGPRPFTEPERVARFRKAVRSIPRLNCNISGYTAFAWITPEQDVNDPFDWHGLASKQTVERYPAGTEMTRSAKLMRGQLADRPPKRPIMACPGMPPMDRDGDGTPDFRDSRPLNPNRR